MADPTGKESTARQVEIIDCVLHLVREAGLGNLTIRRIAEKVGFTEAALYRHFPTKGDLILGLMDRLDEMMLEPVQRIGGERDTPAAERILRILGHHARLIREHNSLPILLLAEASASGDPTLIDRMRSIFHGYLSVLEEVIRDGQAKGEFTQDLNAQSLALVFLGAPAALAIRHRLLPDAEVEDEFESTALPLLADLIAKPKRRTP